MEPIDTARRPADSTESRRITLSARFLIRPTPRRPKTSRPCAETMSRPLLPQSSPPIDLRRAANVCLQLSDFGLWTLDFGLSSKPRPPDRARHKPPAPASQPPGPAECRANDLESTISSRATPGRTPA